MGSLRLPFTGPIVCYGLIFLLPRSVPKYTAATINGGTGYSVDMVARAPPRERRRPIFLLPLSVPKYTAAANRLPIQCQRLFRVISGVAEPAGNKLNQPSPRIILNLGLPVDTDG